MEGLDLPWVVTTLVAIAGLVLALVSLWRTWHPDDRGGTVASTGRGSGAAEEVGEDWVERRLDALEAAMRDLDPRPPAPGLSAGSTGRSRGPGLGLVRFDAFEDTGGSQSFALALLDGDDEGVVLSSLHSRQSTRLYVKRVKRGAADLPLSAEETLALEQARARAVGASAATSRATGPTDRVTR